MYSEQVSLQLRCSYSRPMKSIKALKEEVNQERHTIDFMSVLVPDN